MSKMKELLPANHIQVEVHPNDWEEAVKIAAKPLLEERLIQPLYVEKMIESVKDNGPYMVLTDYFALMHARPGEGVTSQSMSLLVTDEPIDMAGKPVKIFLVLAAKDSTSHLESLQEIMGIFMDDSNYHLILNGNKEEIIKLFE